jgi:glycosyltransferase involved in cell wall biosynthesis
VLAIVPALDEEQTVGEVVRELRALGTVDVVVVNDGSRDATARVAAEAGAAVLEHPFNLGIGAAVQTGYRYAARHGYDVAVQVDGDGQHLPSEIPRLLGPLERGEADLVLGSRYVRPTGYQASAPRRAGMLAFSWLVSAVTGQALHDTTSGFRAAGRDVVAYLARHYPQDYPEVEALVLLKRAGFRIAETECRFRERGGGQSSITPARSAYYMVKVGLAILVGLLRSMPRPGEETEEIAPARGTDA